MNRCGICNSNVHISYVIECSVCGAKTKGIEQKEELAYEYDF